MPRRERDGGLRWNDGLNRPPSQWADYKLKIVGFTGTRRGMTDEQKAGVRALLQKLAPDLAVHGDCVGADDDFDQICLDLGIDRNSRPCTLKNFRAHTEKRKPKPAFETAEPVEPMVRNRLIVADATFMIAAPFNGLPTSASAARGSGTWATVLEARATKKPLYIVFPSGWVRHERFDETVVVEQHYKEMIGI